MGRVFKKKKKQVLLLSFHISYQNKYFPSKLRQVGAGILNIWTCKIFLELFIANFELKFLLNFLDIWNKIGKKEPSDLMGLFFKVATFKILTWDTLYIEWNQIRKKDCNVTKRREANEKWKASLNVSSSVVKPFIAKIRWFYSLYWH